MFTATPYNDPYSSIPKGNESYLPPAEKLEVGFGSLVIAPYCLGWELLKEGFASKEITIPLSRRIFNVVKGALLLVPIVNYLFFLVFANQMKEEYKKSLEKFSEIEENLKRSINSANLSEEYAGDPYTSLNEYRDLSRSMIYPRSVSEDLPPMSQSLILQRVQPLKMKLMTYYLSAKEPKRQSLESIAHMLSKKALDILILQANDVEALESLNSLLSNTYHKSELSFSNSTPGQIILFNRGTFHKSITTRILKNEKSCVVIAKAKHKTSRVSLNVHNVFINKDLKNRTPYFLQNPDLIDHAFEDPSDISIGGGVFHCGVDDLNPLNYHFDKGSGISNPKAKLRDVHLFGSKHVKFSDPHVSYLVNNPSDQNPVLSAVEIAIN